ncbi:hypothetical protein NMG60_11002869 [Bertholletia excelsa]
MLGRVRPSPSSLECLELERPATKIIKDDSLSIYEATLAKLREGSRRALVPLSEQAHGTDESSISASNSSSEEDMAVEISCSSSILSSSTNQHLLGPQRSHRKGMSPLFTCFPDTRILDEL